MDINPNDVEIPNKLHKKGIKSIIVKFQSHKVKSRMYKERAKLKHVRVADLYPESTAATRVESEGICLNENLTSYRRNILKQANHKRKDGQWMGKYLSKHLQREGRSESMIKLI